MITPEQCRAARAILDISQKALADASGVSLTTIKEFEMGKREPKAYVLQALMVILTNRNIRLIEDETQTGVAIAKDGKHK